MEHPYLKSARSPVVITSSITQAVVGHQSPQATSPALSIPQVPHPPRVARLPFRVVVENSCHSSKLIPNNWPLNPTVNSHEVLAPQNFHQCPPSESFVALWGSSPEVTFSRVSLTVEFI